MKETTEIAPVAKPSDLLQVIANAVSDPALDVAKMKELLAMHMEIVREQRREAFDDAMTRLQSKLPQIPKYGQGKNSKFAKLEDLDQIIRPMLAEERFSVSFNEVSQTDVSTTFELEVSRAGHSKCHRLTVYNDKASTNRDGRPIRPPIQDNGSTASYARRYLLKLALNIVEKDEDTDGESLKPISEDQVKDLEVMIKDAKADRAKFLEYMDVADIKDIWVRDLPKAINALEVKKRQK